MQFSELKASEVIKIISSHRLFSGIGAETLRTLLSSDGTELAKYDRGQTIMSCGQDTHKLVFLIYGGACVYSADENRSMTLRTLSEGDAFGVASLFSCGDAPTRVCATKKSEVLLVTGSAYGRFLEENKTAMYNYISFLSDRICYLNRKILCLTAGSAERRLAFFLADCSEQDTFTLPVPMNSLSEMLGLGRASLYRAEAHLVSDGYLVRKGRSITIINRAEMLAHYS